ncbi:manganese transporter [Cladophialophora psammophila CBS 110553]|uniref:Manganese transporter n=1 Tax=Cladophialophora psammophila CBS 110553 TaxID=1182543 RepID=W9Y252_9EURO|nr:manganese transporter [Cladophialophora psammophila CBS 110553]EXJ76549.1 manganese transporter [Cladophialophora psammophila CBS 110553]
MTRLRLFEMFMMCLVLGVVICFCIEPSYIRNSTVGEVFLGYVPSSAVVEGNWIYLSCGIFGATVMPHSIFLGSGVVQTRLRHFDERNGMWPPRNGDEEGRLDTSLRSRSSDSVSNIRLSNLGFRCLPLRSL